MKKFVNLFVMVLVVVMLFGAVEVMASGMSYEEARAAFEAEEAAREAVEREAFEAAEAARRAEEQLAFEEYWNNKEAEAYAQFNASESDRYAYELEEFLANQRELREAAYAQFRDEQARLEAEAYELFVAERPAREEEARRLHAQEQDRLRAEALYAWENDADRLAAQAARREAFEAEEAARVASEYYAWQNDPVRLAAEQARREAFDAEQARLYAEWRAQQEIYENLRNEYDRFNMSAHDLPVAIGRPNLTFGGIVHHHRPGMFQGNVMAQPSNVQLDAMLAVLVQHILANPSVLPANGRTHNFSDNTTFSDEFGRIFTAWGVSIGVGARPNPSGRTGTSSFGRWGTATPAQANSIWIVIDQFKDYGNNELNLVAPQNPGDFNPGEFENDVFTPGNGREFDDYDTFDFEEENFVFEEEFEFENGEFEFENEDEFVFDGGTFVFERGEYEFEDGVFTFREGRFEFDGNVFEFIDGEFVFNGRTFEFNGRTFEFDFGSITQDPEDGTVVFTPGPSVVLPPNRNQPEEIECEEIEYDEETEVLSYVEYEEDCWLCEEIDEPSLTIEVLSYEEDTVYEYSDDDNNDEESEESYETVSTPPSTPGMPQTGLEDNLAVLIAGLLFSILALGAAAGSLRKLVKNHVR